MFRRLAKWLHRTRQSVLWLGSIGLLACSGAPVQSGTSDRLDPDTEIAPFVSELVSRHGFESERLMRILGGVRVRPDVLEAIARPAESLDWYQYRPIFMTETRIAKGEKFWRAHADTLAAASREFGVPPRLSSPLSVSRPSMGHARESTWCWIPWRPWPSGIRDAANSSARSSSSFYCLRSKRASTRRR